MHTKELGMNIPEDSGFVEYRNDGSIAFYFKSDDEEVKYFFKKSELPSAYVKVKPDGTEGYEHPEVYDTSRLDLKDENVHKAISLEVFVEFEDSDAGFFERLFNNNTIRKSAGITVSAERFEDMDFESEWTEEDVFRIIVTPDSG